MKDDRRDHRNSRRKKERRAPKRASNIRYEDEKITRAIEKRFAKYDTK